MSDGPHRSLKLSKPWRELAKRGDQRTYDASDVADAATTALASDFNEVKASLIACLKAVFTGVNNSLELPEIALQELEHAKRLAAGSVFGENAVAMSKELVADGKFGLNAFYEAIGIAAKLRGFAAIRSIEEHYVRQSNQRRASSMSQRLHIAFSGLATSHLGAMIVEPRAGASKRTKKSDIDEGVALI